MSGQPATVAATRYYPTPGGALLVRDTSGLSYLATDALGTPIATVNLDTGAVLGEQLRAPYGEARYGVVAGAPSAGGMHSTVGFTGQREDTASSGLAYFNAREYDPAVGRFTSADTVVGADAALDGYAYVGGMTETAVDPSGNEAILDSLSALGNDGSVPPAGGSGTGVAIVLGLAVVVTAAAAAWWDECQVTPSLCGNVPGGAGSGPSDSITPVVVVTQLANGQFAEIIVLPDSGQIQVLTTSKRGTSVVSYLPSDPQYLTYITLVDQAYQPPGAGNQVGTHVHVNVPPVSEVLDSQIFAARTPGKVVQGIPSQGPITRDGDPPGTPPVDAGETGKHVKGHDNNTDPGRSVWATDVDIVEETIRAWQNGKPVPGQPQCVSAPAGCVIGTKGETWVKVHQKQNGWIHGVPEFR